jgi:hypothetical protein
MSERSSAAAAVLGLSLLAGCGGNQPAAPKTVENETAEAEVTRIARAWSSTQIEKSLLSPPSPISVQVSARTSRIEFGSQGGREQLTVDEQFELRTGGRVHCLTRFDHTVGLRFGRKGGEAAIEVTRPPLRARRNCDGSAPEATLSEGQRRVLLVLSADQLVAVDPPLDERIYRPVSE